MIAPRKAGTAVGHLAVREYNCGLLPTVNTATSHGKGDLRPAEQPTQKPAQQSYPMNRVLVLLGLSVLINYIDRSNLSIAAPLIKDELGISAAQLGTLLSAFFYT